MKSDAAKQWKSWGVALFALAVLGLKIWSRWQTAPAAPLPAEANPLLPYWPLFAACAVFIPVILLATTGFTFDYRKPVLLWLRMRLRLALILWIIAAVFATVLFEERIAAGLGVPLPVLLGLGLVLLVAVVQLLSAQIEGRALHRRLQALGEALPQIDPVVLRQRSLQGQWTQLDAGLLFRESADLRFVGDRLNLRLGPASLRREIIPGTLGGMLGHKGLVLALPMADGTTEEARVSIHGAWNPLRDEEDADQIALRVSG